MPPEDDIASAVAEAAWPERVALIRRVPEGFGTARQADVYAAVAARVYAPSLAPDFAYVHWRDQYELATVARAYSDACRLTEGFTRVDVDSIAAALADHPAILRIFRLILGFTLPEFSAAVELGCVRQGIASVKMSHLKSMEEGTSPQRGAARACAETITLVMANAIFPSASPNVRSKLAKPDTVHGWDTVRGFARDGVPFEVFLHQRHYGGAFRQLLDATSSQRGNVVEDAVEELFSSNGVPYLRTGSESQEEIARRFGLTVRPAPDFAVHDSSGTLRGILECKAANDGGTARDKAARFRSLRAEATRLGGVPLFAVLSGLGWRRARDALGPVVRDTDGRVFSLSNLSEILQVDPMPGLVGHRPT